MPTAQLIVRTHLAATYPPDETGEQINAAWLRSFLLSAPADTVAPGVIGYRRTGLVIATVPDTDEVIIMGRIDFDSEVNGVPVDRETISAHIGSAGPNWLAPNLADPVSVVFM